MRTILFDQLLSIILGVAMVVLTGCASSSPSKFYQLNPTGAQTSVTRDEPRLGSVIVSIGPVRIPDYLDRPQIVTRSGKNELNLAEFHRWAGSLESDVARVLVEDISSLLPADRFFITRWAPFSESQLPVSYKVELRVDHFEGTLGDSVLLKTQWGIFSREKGLLLKRETSISEQVNGATYDAMVEAMSRALERLSRDIADSILSVAAESKKDSHYLPVPADRNKSAPGRKS
jgi:uncharacterized lipoprotein YmbA